MESVLFTYNILELFWNSIFFIKWETCDSLCIMKMCYWRKYLAIILFNFVMWKLKINTLVWAESNRLALQITDKHSLVPVWFQNWKSIRDHSNFALHHFNHIVHFLHVFVHFSFFNVSRNIYRQYMWVPCLLSLSLKEKGYFPSLGYEYSLWMYREYQDVPHSCSPHIPFHYFLMRCN